MSGSFTTRTPNRPRARRRAVGDEPVVGGAGYDYADAFEIRVPEADSRTAEQFARAALDRAPRALLWVVRLAHRYVLRLRLGPPSSPEHIIGWQIVTSEPDVIRLEASGPLACGVIVARRVEPTRAVLTTLVFFGSPAARMIWAIAGPLHRRIAPYLLERAAAD